MGEVNPAILARAGFRVAALEAPVGVGVNRVVIDVLLAHDQTGLLVACESKSGASIDAVQAAKYVALDAQAVVHAGSVDLPNGVRPTVTVLYTCQDHHAERIRLGLDRAGVAVAVLAVGRNEAQLFDAHHTSAVLASALGPGRVLLPAGIARIVPCDQDSPVDIVRRHVRAVLVAHLSRRTPQVAAQVVAAETLTSLPIYGQGARHRFHRTVNKALGLIAADEPETFEYQKMTGTRDALVRFLRTPEDNDPRGRTQAYQALARQGHTRPRATALDPNQLDLLQELVATDDVGAADDTDLDKED